MNLGLFSMMLYVAPHVYICFSLQSHHHTLFPPTHLFQSSKVFQMSCYFRAFRLAWSARRVFLRGVSEANASLWRSRTYSSQKSHPKKGIAFPLSIITPGILRVLALLRQQDLALMCLLAVTLFEVDTLRFWTSLQLCCLGAQKKHLVRSSQIFVNCLSGFSLLRLLVWADFNGFWLDIKGLEMFLYANAHVISKLIWATKSQLRPRVLLETSVQWFNVKHTGSISKLASPLGTSKVFSSDWCML